MAAQALRARNASRPSLSDRFWSTVQSGPADACWPWLGYKKPTGYGIAYNGKRVLHAHRLAFQLTTGHVVARGEEVRHKCDNRACCNPHHLELGSHSDNMRDMVVRGRSCRGEDKPDAKLTEAAVRTIRAAFRRGGITKQALAEEYGVCADTIRSVVTRERWSHIG